MIKKILACTAVATVAALLGLPGVAQALNSWHQAPCATGSFGAVTVDAQGHYRVPAQIAQCDGYQQGYSWAVALFRPGDANPAIHSDQLQPYPQPGSTGVTIDYRPPPATPVFGLCLMRVWTARVACLRVDTAVDGTVTGTPIPVGDSLISRLVLFVESNPDQPSYCAVCVFPDQ
ncbi:hypothetical protein ACGFJ7_21205 [Actinoplanes sp. NPDC048988]|uniref:hypothetical protein n=1 Tax=Actinoplanes sp. NPDC048988 TaxID=3363901 RepID=UPI00371A4300